MITGAAAAFVALDRELIEEITRGTDGVITDEVSRAVETRQRLAAGPIMFYLEQARGLVAIP